MGRGHPVGRPRLPGWLPLPAFDTWVLGDCLKLRNRTCCAALPSKPARLALPGQASLAGNDKEACCGKCMPARLAWPLPSGPDTACWHPIRCDLFVSHGHPGIHLEHCTIWAGRRIADVHPSRSKAVTISKSVYLSHPSDRVMVDTLRSSTPEGASLCSVYHFPSHLIRVIPEARLDVSVYHWLCSQIQVKGHT